MFRLKLNLRVQQGGLQIGYKKIISSVRKKIFFEIIWLRYFYIERKVGSDSFNYLLVIDRVFQFHWQV